MSFDSIIEDIKERFYFLSNFINHQVIKLEDLIDWLLKLTFVVWIEDRVFKRLIKSQPSKLCPSFVKMCKWPIMARFRIFTWHRIKRPNIDEGKWISIYWMCFSLKISCIHNGRFFDNNCNKIKTRLNLILKIK